MPATNATDAPAPAAPASHPSPDLRGRAALPQLHVPGAWPIVRDRCERLVTTAHFGFMTMERDGAGWVLRAWDVDGKPVTSCTLAQRKLACTPIAAP